MLESSVKIDGIILILKSYTSVTFETPISKVHFHSLMKESVKILQ